MLKQFLKNCSKKRVCRAPKKFLLLLTLFMLALQFQPATAQGLVVQDTTITASATFSASEAIIIGPKVVIGDGGEATFAAKKTFFTSRFVVANGGKMYVLSQGLPTSLEPAAPLLPADFVVHQNYPNPFNPATRISYVLPAAAKVEIVIFNSLGQKVKTLFSAQQSPGNHAILWDATNDAGSRVGSGVYYYRVTVGENNIVAKKMILTK